MYSSAGLRCNTNDLHTVIDGDNYPRNVTPVTGLIYCTPQSGTTRLLFDPFIDVSFVYVFVVINLNSGIDDECIP